MNNNTIENIIENLFYVLPVLHKKLLKIEPQDVDPCISPSRLQVGIMLALNEENGLPISEIARRLLIPKPQMTRLISQIVDMGIADKMTDPQDRRVTKIVLTEKGKSTLAQCENFLKSNVRKHLSHLTPNELEELSAILARLRDLGSRLEKKQD